ncbi:MAG TPA: zf-HC2 domain-containing protein [Planctomycetota bacterium]|nr:zf-HC2 domain-containing protein [Planctomycetota bacterium]
MTCDDALAQFSAVLDGELEASDGLEAHLADCEPCREQARRAAMIDRLSLEIAVENRRLASTTGLLRISRRSRTRARRTALLAGLAAATLLAASAAFYRYVTEPLPEPPVAVAPPSSATPDLPATRPEPPPAPEKSAPTAPAVVDPSPPVKVDPPAVEAPTAAAEPRPAVAPAPKPAPAPAARPVAPTVAAAATLERGDGEVYRITADGRTLAKAGEPLFKGQTLHTEGVRSRAVVAYANGSSVELRGGTNLQVGDNALYLSEGAIDVRIAETPMAFSTPHAQVSGRDSSLTLQVCDEASMLRVVDGGVQWTRRADGVSQNVAAGAPPAWALSQQAKNPAAAHPKVDQKRVDDAIKKGIAYLKASDDSGRAQELLIWTYLHAGMSPEESHIKVPLDRMLAGKLARTYNVALQAMILEKLDRVKHQVRIFHCAQFLTDNQWESGQWGYGKETNLPDPPKGVPSADRAKVATAAKKAGALNLDQKIVTLRLPVTKQALDLQSRGDNSNTQYALLGMRACHDAGILFPAETIARVDKFWRENQSAPAGKKPGDRPSVASGANAYPPAGWSYGAEAKTGNAYGSMTVGGLGGLCIIDYIQGKDWKRDPDVLEGVNWVASNFSVTENPGRKEAHHYYYLYGLERAGVLFGTDFFGAHEWYPAGANYLLDQQKPDGSWAGSGKEGGAVIDTCFAILFLKRATKPLPDVASVENRK